ncbi:septum formation initiator family protein [Hazenella sp. IB182357]|uniref:Septum formation initiator family protein n=1 Tax=Polycladospora coralii TaxID=2771432 RepID=A0A926NFN5_9BACL|nr:septum formation initiator family protein [Polycladospora coralii]MBD1372453.1 septum formation initiator family protein [Polycladospora coralii]MBS7531775.1 septum formation initiator family protein [Polycladospora coralii]
MALERGNVFQMRHNHSKKKPTDEEKTKQAVHPIVRRRRLLWLSIMLLFIGWTLVQLLVQKNEMWDLEDHLQAKEAELKTVQSKTDVLKKEIKQLHNDEYLLEQAHKMGYREENEALYKVEEN